MSAEGEVAEINLRNLCNPRLNFSMDVRDINKTQPWFEVLQTRERSQTVMMTLAPGASTGDKTGAHPKSKQVLLLLKGELTSEVGDERLNVRKNNVIIIPAGMKHRFTNHAEKLAVTLTFMHHRLIRPEPRAKQQAMARVPPST
jgi:mannose-6-phosphate isomerase-like protein (cupin superfamily)